MPFDSHRVVDSEDGALILGDAADIMLWNVEASDDSQAPEIVDAIARRINGLAVKVGSGRGIIWNLDGPGTVDVFFGGSDTGATLVRAWCDEGADLAIPALVDLPITSVYKLGEFSVTSGYIAVLWTGESGRCIRRSEHGGYCLSESDMMTVSSGLLIATQNGTYACYHDEIELDHLEARRCRIVAS